MENPIHLCEVTGRHRDLNLTFNATTLSGGQEALLASGLTSGWAVLNGWTFTATGYTAGTPVYLSLDVGSGYAVNELAVWHYDGSVWTPYTPTDLAYDGTHANFTVTGFSGYAVTAIPEPATLTLLALAGMSMLVRRKPCRPARGL